MGTQSTRRTQRTGKNGNSENSESSENSENREGCELGELGEPGRMGTQRTRRAPPFAFYYQQSCGKETSFITLLPSRRRIQVLKERSPSVRRMMRAPLPPAMLL